MPPPITPAELEALLPLETDDLCEAIIKAGQFDAGFAAIYKWMFNEDGTFTEEFLGEICTSCSSTTTTVTTTSTTTPTSTSTTTAPESAWVAHDSNRKWTDVACSDDGAYAVACVDAGYVYVTNDSGSTWTEVMTVGQRAWVSVTVSPNGVIMFAAASTGELWTSVDNGVTWTDVAPTGGANWVDIAVSSDGQTIHAVSASLIHLSTDGGSNFATYFIGTNTFTGIACSSGGAIAYASVSAVASANNVWVTTDTGATWNVLGTGPTGVFADVFCSSNGAKIIVGGTNGSGTGAVFVSTNSGASWTEFNPAYGNSVGASADGSTFISGADNVLPFGKKLWLSTDSGNSFHESLSAVKLWKGVALSSNGAVKYGVAYNDKVYTSP